VSIRGLDLDPDGFGYVRAARSVSGRQGLLPPVAGREVPGRFVWAACYALSTEHYTL
jgi:hypothetical protein